MLFPMTRSSKYRLEQGEGICCGPTGAEDTFRFVQGAKKKGFGKLKTCTDNFADHANGLLAIGSADVPMGD
jgi:hypothetical protein